MQPPGDLPPGAAPKRRRSPKTAAGAAVSVRSVNYSVSPLLASRTPAWRSKFLVAMVGLGFCVLVGRALYVQVIGADVIHAFAVPSFGIKIDAIPGRRNETWFKATREGVYYGQCSKLCGKDHSNMPMEIKVVSEAAYQAWLADAKKQFAAGSTKTKAAEIKPAAASVPVRLAGAQ